jgi:hypothetical protein
MQCLDLKALLLPKSFQVFDHRPFHKNALMSRFNYYSFLHGGSSGHFMQIG